MFGVANLIVLEDLRDLRGAVSEWLKGPHWKCGVRETAPRVRIPPAPYLLIESGFLLTGTASRRVKNGDGSLLFAVARNVLGAR